MTVEKTIDISEKKRRLRRAVAHVGRSVTAEEWADFEGIGRVDDAVQILNRTPGFAYKPPMTTWGRDGVVGELLRNLAESLDDFMAGRHSRRHGVYRAAPNRADGQSERPLVTLVPGEEGYAAAQVEWLALEAATQGEIRRFRALFLGRRWYPAAAYADGGDAPQDGWKRNSEGLDKRLAADPDAAVGLLNADEAQSFLTSPALAWCSAEQLAAWGVPFLDHRAEYDPPDAEGRLFEPGPVRIVTTWGDDPVHRRVVEVPVEARLAAMWAILQSRRGWGHACVGNSPMGHLRYQAEKQSDHFGWLMEHTVSWLLRGEPTPFISPIDSQVVTDRDGRRIITLRMYDWVLPDRVRDIYRSLQRPRGATRQRYRDKRGMQLCALAFRLSKLRGNGEEWEKLGPPPEQLYERWNKDHPDDRFGSLDEMRVTFNRAWATFNRASYGPDQRAHEKQKQRREQKPANRVLDAG